MTYMKKLFQKYTSDFMKKNIKMILQELSTIKRAILTLITEEKFNNRDAEKLRGYFSDLYKDEDLFHNHIKGNKFAYRFPKVQYKVINGMLSVIGIDEGADLVASKFLLIKELNISDKIIKNFETEISIKDEDVLVDDNLYTYKFITPWLCINQKNYKTFKCGQLDLDTVLRNNIISNLKGLGVFADKKIMVKGRYKQVKVKIKDIDIIGFYGMFTTNVKMPDHVGVGKRKSIGFGSVVKV